MLKRNSHQNTFASFLQREQEWRKRRVRQWEECGALVFFFFFLHSFTLQLLNQQLYFLPVKINCICTVDGVRWTGINNPHSSTDRIDLRVQPHRWHRMLDLTSGVCSCWMGSVCCRHLTSGSDQVSFCDLFCGVVSYLVQILYNVSQNIHKNSNRVFILCILYREPHLVQYVVFLTRNAC